MDDRVTEVSVRRRAPKGARWAWAIFSIVIALALVYWFARRGQPMTSTMSGGTAAHGNVAPTPP